MLVKSLGWLDGSGGLFNQAESHDLANATGTNAQRQQNPFDIPGNPDGFIGVISHIIG